MAIRGAIRPPKDYKPNVGYRVNRASPIAKGITFCVPFASQDGVDIAGQRMPTVSGNTWWKIGSKGKTRHFDGTLKSDYGRDTRIETANFTAAVWCRQIGAQANYSAPFCKTWQDNGGPTYVSWDIVYNPSSAGDNVTRCDVGISGGIATTSNYTMADATIPHVNVITFDGSTLLQYIDGTQVGNVSSGGAVVYDTGATSQLFVSGASSGAGNQFGGEVYLAVIWDRALSSKEVAEFAADPIGSILRAQDSMPLLYVDTASGGAAAALAGDAVGVTTAAGALSTGIPLAGASVTVATAAGNITTGIPLAVAASAVVTAAGDLATEIKLAAAAVAQALAAGDMTTGIPLAGAATGVATATGDLTIQIRLDGAAVAVVTATGDLGGGSAELAGAAAAVATAVGDIATGIPLLGAALTVVSASGDILTEIPLSGAAASVTTVIGSLDTSITMSVAALVQALAAGDLTAQITFSGAALAQATAAGTLSGGSYAAPPASRSVRVRAWSRSVPVKYSARQLRIKPESRQVAA